MGDEVIDVYKVTCPYCHAYGYTQQSSVHPTVRRYLFGCGTFAMLETSSKRAKIQMTRDCYTRYLVYRKESTNGAAVGCQ